MKPNDAAEEKENLRVSVAEWFDTDEHPDVISGLELSFAPLYFIVICEEIMWSWSDEGGAD